MGQIVRYLWQKVLERFTERWQSGRLRSLGKRVYLTVSRVRIPSSPPKLKRPLTRPFFCFESESVGATSVAPKYPTYHPGADILRTVNV